MVRWKNNYIYYVLIGATFVSLIADKGVYEFPTWGTLLGILFLAYAAGDQSWKALKRMGRAAVLVSLKATEGGHSTIHPDDITIAMNRRGVMTSGGDLMPSFMVFATGGFVHSGLEWKGNENFVVCPPEHCESTGPAFICYTKLRRVDFDVLPDYVQVELRNLTLFKEMPAKTRRNIWFGMTSKRDGTSTSQYLELESKFLDQTRVINTLKGLLKDKPQLAQQKGSKNEQFVINIPEQ